MPKLSEFKLENKITFKTKEQLLNEYNESNNTNKEMKDFHWTLDKESFVNYYNEQNEQLDYVSNPNNSKIIIQMLLNDFKNKYDISLDYDQVQYYMTRGKLDKLFSKNGGKVSNEEKQKDEEIADKREELEKKFIERQGKKVVDKSVESAPWEVVKKGELDEFPLIANKFNYTKMYFGLIGQVGKQLDKKLKENTQAKKETFRNLLMDFGLTMMGIYAACGGFQVNSDKEYCLEEGHWVRANVRDGNTVLASPMLGNASEKDYFMELNKALPVNFLRDKTIEDAFDYKEIGKTVNPPFNKGQISYLSNQLKEAKRTYDSHWAITKYFSTLSIFKNNKFFKKVRSEARECRNLEKVAMLFAPSGKKYKNDQEKISRGSERLLKFANNRVNETLQNLSDDFRKEIKDNIISNVHSKLGISYAVNIAGAARFRALSLDSMKHQYKGDLSRSYGTYALKKISEVTNMENLYIGNIKGSSIDTYGEDSLNKEKTVNFLTSEGYGINKDTYDTWTLQIDSGLVNGDLTIESKENLSELLYGDYNMKDEDKELALLNTYAVENNYSDIKFEADKDVVLEGTENNVSKEEVENVIKGTKYEDKIKTDDLPSKNDLDTENYKEEELIESEEEINLDLLGEHVGGGKTNKKSKFIEDKEKSKENEKGIGNN